MNKKRNIIIGVAAAVLIILVILLLVLNKTHRKNDKNNSSNDSNSNITSNVEEKITIKFDSAGGSEVEEIEIKKSKTISLPVTTRDGYNFMGWYLKDEQVTSDTKFDSDVTLLAHWEEIPKDAKTFVIKYDTDGGSEVADMTLECGKGLRFPSKPTKEGYTFVNWINKNNKVVLEGTKLACDDITLKAQWKKNETPKSNEPVTVESNSTSNVETKKEYVCTEGILDGNKCVTSISAKEKCPDGKFEYDGKCVTVNGSSRVDAVKTCGKDTIIKPYGHTEEVQGEYFNMGASYCFYGIVDDSYEQQEPTNCTTRGHAWNSQNEKCYYKRGDANANITSSCSSSSYVYISNPNQFSGVNGLNGGCFPTSSKINYCDKEGYTLSGTKCIKIVDAQEK